MSEKKAKREGTTDKCPVCGQEFLVYHNKQCYCSYKCSAEAGRRKAAESYSANVRARKERLVELEAENEQLKTQIDSQAKMVEKLEAQITAVNETVARLTEENEQLKKQATAVAEAPKVEVSQEEEEAARKRYEGSRAALENDAQRTKPKVAVNGDETRWCKRLGRYIEPALACGNFNDCDIPHPCPDKPRKKKK